MRFDGGDWNDHPASPAGHLREQRSGLTGFGARPALHPAWRVSEADGERPGKAFALRPPAAARR